MSRPGWYHDGHLAVKSIIVQLIIQFNLAMNLHKEECKSGAFVSLAVYPPSLRQYLLLTST